MSEPETPAPEPTPEQPAETAAAAPELDVTQPVAPAEAPPLEPGPAPVEDVTVSGGPPAEVTVETPAPVDTGVLQDLLAELRELKAKIVAAIGG